MADFVLSCCSTVDLTVEHLEKRQIAFANFHYFLDGEEYVDDMGQSLSLEEFYRRMTEGADTRTAQVNVDEYTRFFTTFLEQGQDVLHIALSSGLSGSFNSARIAAELLSEKYPERKLYIVDSLAASSGAGLIMETLADMRDSGMSIDELHDWIEEHRLEMHHWFCSTDLTFYVKGGRVTKAAGWFGTVLKICPVLNVDNLGRLIPRFKIRGKHTALKELANQMVEHAAGGTAYDGKVYMCHSACLQDAEMVAREVEKRFPNLKEPVKIFSIGPTIGSHSGPGTVALFFWGNKREN